MPQAQVIGRGSSGIATFATVLDAKYADCHTPRCPRPRWFDLLNIGWEWLAVPPWVLRLLVGLSLRFPHPYKYIIPQRE